MGITFRSGKYKKFVRLGGRTIKDGEAAVVWNNHGVAEMYVGPMRVNLWFSTIQFLDRFKAEPHQYLRIRNRDGSVEHRRGPVSVYQSPTLVDAIEVLEGIKLETDDHAVVVCNGAGVSLLNTKSTEKAEPSKRRIVYGPMVYFPSVDETIHSFQWKEPSHDLQKLSSSNRRDGPLFQVVSTKQCYFWNTKLMLRSLERHHIPIEIAISYHIDSVDKCIDAQDPFQLLEPALLSDALNCNLTETEIVHKNDTPLPAFREAMAATGLRLLKIQVVSVKESLEARQAKSESKVSVEEHIKDTETRNTQKLQYLKGLKELDVDLTKVLIATAGNVDFE